MNYEWDEQKRATNITKHGVDFVEIENFDWATALTILDTRFEESRYAALGLIEKSPLCCCLHSQRNIHSSYIYEKSQQERD